MRVMFSSRALDQFVHWQREDHKLALRVIELINAARCHPFTGIGKPEPLRNELSGFWSRRITQEHRLVYRVTGTCETQTLEIAACWFHH
jgi:toxin YoeB